MRLEDFVTLSEIDPDLLSDVGHPNDFILTVMNYDSVPSVRHMASHFHPT